MFTYGIQNAGHPWSLQRLGSEGLRFELRAGDVWSGDGAASGKERTEILSAQNYPAGNVEVEYDLVIEPGSPNTAKFLVIGQWHPMTGDNSPVPLDVELIGENMAVVIRSVAVPYTILWKDPNPIIRGHAYHFNWYVTADPVSGSFVILRDGVPIASGGGPLGSGLPMYWKNGLYRTASPETIAAQYTNLTIT